LKPVPDLVKCRFVASGDGTEVKLLGVASPLSSLADGLLSYVAGETMFGCLDAEDSDEESE
jgi:hypothetical protein